MVANVPVQGAPRLQVCEIIKQVCDEPGMTTTNGVLSRDPVHVFVQIPLHISVSDCIRFET